MFVYRCLPFLLWGRQITRHTLWDDFLAALTGAVIVLPQGVAYALIAGLPPEYGLYSAIIIPIIAGLFGSSHHLISGPAAAISIVVLSIVSSIVPPDSAEFIPAVLALTVLTGLIQLGLGIARMGALVNFISHTVVIGFTAGAAIVIATSQVKYVLGINVAAGSSFLETWQTLWSQLDNTNTYSLAIALTTIVSTLFIKKVHKRLPAMLIGMLAGSLACWLLQGTAHNVPMVGALPGKLPQFALPDFSAQNLGALLSGAITLAILGLVEAVSISRAIAIRSGQRIDGNQEFIGQGLANLLGGFFSCFAGSGSFTRTGVNYESGAKTPLAAIFTALMLVLIVLFAPQITAYLPLPAMGGGILLIAWNLIDKHHIQQILLSNKQEASVLLVTFASTLLIELEFAIYLGVLVSLIIYLKRTSTPVIMEVAPKSLEYGTDLRSISRFQLDECHQLKILRIDGSIFFGAADHIQKTLQAVKTNDGRNNQILINCAGINFIDVTGAEMLLHEAKRLNTAGGQLSFCSLKNTVRDELEANGYLKKLGDENFYATVDSALNALIPRLNGSSCQTCSKRVFKQCPKTD